MDDDNDDNNDNDDDDTHPPQIIVHVGMVFRRGQKYMNKQFFKLYQMVQSASCYDAQEPRYIGFLWCIKKKHTVQPLLHAFVLIIKIVTLTQIRGGGGEWGAPLIGVPQGPAQG